MSTGELTYLPRSRFRSPRTRDTVLVTAAVAAFAAVLVASVGYAADAPVLVFVPLGLVAGVLGCWLLAAAYAGSPAAIMIYFAAITFVTDAQFRVRGAGDIDADWQSLLKFALWIGAGVIGAGHMPPLERLMGRPGPALWLAYIVIALLSSLYSPIPAYSFGCAFALLCFFAFAYALITRLSEGQIFWTFVLTLTVFNAISWVVFVAYPELGTSAAWTYEGILYRMCGIAGQATNLGEICAKYVGAVFLLWWAGRCRLLPALILVAFGAVTLVATDCRTMIIATGLGIAAVVASRSAWLLAGGVLATLALLAVFLLVPHLSDALGAHFSRSGDATEVYTLTGRLEIWNFVWRQIMERPVLGWGYNSSKAVLGQHLGFENGLMVDSAHNLFLQSLLSVGFIGTVPLIGVLVLLGARLLMRPPPLVAYFAIIVLIGSVSDTSAVGTTPTLLTLLFLMISIWPTTAELRAAERPPRPPRPGARRFPPPAARWRPRGRGDLKRGCFLLAGATRLSRLAKHLGCCRPLRRAGPGQVARAWTSAPRRGALRLCGTRRRGRAHALQPPGRVEPDVRAAHHPVRLGAELECGEPG